MKTKMRRLTLGSLLLAVVIASGLAFVLSQGRQLPPQTSTTSLHPAGLPFTLFDRDHGPYGHGVKVSLGEAEAQAGSLVLYRPNSDLASDSTIRNVYIESLTGDVDITHVAIDYDSGVLVTIDPAGGDLAVDPKGFYEEVAKEADGRSVTTILGLPALEIQRDVDGAGNPASISLVVNGEELTIYGMYAPLEAKSLEQVAETVIISIPSAG